MIPATVRRCIGFLRRCLAFRPLRGENSALAVSFLLQSFLQPFAGPFPPLGQYFHLDVVERTRCFSF